MMSERGFLKFGRAVFDDLEKKMTSEVEEKDLREILSTLKGLEKKALRVWLQAQIDSYPDLLSTNKALEAQMFVYRRILDSM